MTQHKFEKWHGCYDDGWKATPPIIVDESFAHPAKFARGLIERIITHGLERGYWKAGDVIGDPFGGVALGGIICGYHGLNWLGVELEEKFVQLGRQNLDLHRDKIKMLGYDVTLELHQGDSRQFAELVDGICTSPPYIEMKVGGNNPGVERRRVARKIASGDIDPATAGKYSQYSQDVAPDYGSTPGQIGRLPAGSLDGVVTSPPYADAVRQTVNGIDWDKADPKWHTSTRKDTPGRRSIADGYGSTPGNIGNLKSGSLDGICTSPPWAESSLHGVDTNPERMMGGECAPSSHGGGKAHYLNPESPGHIGNTNTETYWQAVATVYQQCLKCLKPGGVMAVVVKDYVSKGKRVPLCDDTLRLLVSLGFQPVERIHAMLVREWTEETLFDGPEKKRKERKSFFRRLAENRGSPRIDWEEVLFVRAGQMGLFRQE